MKNYNVEITRIDEYEITIDENVWDEAYLKDWSETFHNADLEGIASHLAFSAMRFGTGVFFEGFGHVKTYYKNGNEMAQFGDFEKYCKGISVRIISEDEDIDSVITEKITN